MTDIISTAIANAICGRDTVPDAAKDYVDRRTRSKFATHEEYLAHRQAQLDASTTVYVGNLGFQTSEELISRHFSSCGSIRHIFMGLHAVTRKPCGFCFVEYATRQQALDAANHLNGSILDDRVVRVSIDVGGVREQGRFWGRSITGGQVRDQVRQNVDPGRGGAGMREAAALGLTEESGAAASSSNEDGCLEYLWEQQPPWITKAAAANNDRGGARGNNNNNNNNKKRAGNIRPRSRGK